MKKKFMGKVTGGLLAVCLVVVAGGCGSDSSKYSDAYAVSNTAEESAYYEDNDYYENYASEAYEEYDGDWGSGGDVYAEEIKSEVSVGEGAGLAETDRKLIRTVNLEVETTEFDAAIGTLQQEVNALGGYIENMNLYNGSRYSDYYNARSANMMLRIPKNKTDDFLTAVSDISNVISHSESVDDVTLSYSDLESHKAVLKAEHERLLAFMEQAESIEDMLTIENRLSNIQYQLESMESQLRTYDNKVDYSTVNLQIQEVKVLTPVIEEEEPTIWQRMREGFVENMNDIIDGLKEFCVWFVVHIPNFIVCAIVVLIFVLIIRAFVKKGKKKKAGETQITEQDQEQNKEENSNQ